MDYAEANSLVQQLATGFETLQDEYQKLFGRHQALQRKLATAREQVSLPTFPTEMHPSSLLPFHDETTISSRPLASCIERQPQTEL